MNDIDLARRVAVITGGSGGIGLAIAERMRQSGARVVLWDLSQDSLDAARSRDTAFAGLPGRRDRRRLAAGRDARHARARPAASTSSSTRPASAACAARSRAYPVDQWRKVIEVNLTGTFLACRAVVPAMQEQNYGRIVNIASIAGKEGNPFGSAYSASKAGVISLTKSLAKELARHRDPRELRRRRRRSRPSSSTA